MKSINCQICGDQIVIAEEKYTEMTDWIGNKVITTIFLHDDCFRNRFKSLIHGQKIASQLFRKLK